MESVAAALGDHIDVDTKVSAVLGGIGAGLNFHFLHGFDHGLRGRGGDEVVHDADAVERHGILNLSGTSADESLAGGDALGALGAGQDACGGGGQHHGIATVHGQVGQLFAGDDGGNSGVIRLDKRCTGLHRDGLGDGTGGKGEIVPDGLVDIHHAALALGFSETGKFGGNGVGAVADEVDAIVTILIGCC